MSGTIRAFFGRASAGLVMLAVFLTSAPVTVQAHERLLRCATSPVQTGPGHHRQHFAQHRFYAPVNSAMFFSHAGSLCRWKSGRDRRG